MSESQTSVDKLAKDLLLDRKEEYLKKCIIEGLSQLNNYSNRYEVTDKVIKVLDNLNVIFPEVTGSCDIEQTDYGFQIKLFKYYWEKDWVLSDIKITYGEIDEKHI